MESRNEEMKILTRELAFLHGKQALRFDFLNLLALSEFDDDL